jgi:hypothetical protein
VILAERAMATYESLRLAVLMARRITTQHAALRFHGMLHGLSILSQLPPPPLAMVRPTLSPQARPGGDQLVRLLANLVLCTHSELMHVY